MPKVKTNSEKKTDIFPWDIFKADIISFLIKKYSSVLMTFKSVQ